MLQQTDMNGVKSIARTLLMIEIYKTQFSPMVVQHPFTNSGITAIVKDGVIHPLDITENDNNLQAWQKCMTEIIDQAEKPYDIYMMINKPYGLTFLRFASKYLSQKDFSEMLSDAWIRSENPNSDPNLTKSQLLRMFKDADPAILMSPEERKQLAELNDTVAIYRGVTSHNKTIGHALSWTLNQKTAEWFAHRFESAGFVYQAQVDKKNIIALFNGRNESEIIVDLKNLPVISQAEENTNRGGNPYDKITGRSISPLSFTWMQCGIQRTGRQLRHTAVSPPMIKSNYRATNPKRSSTQIKSSPTPIGVCKGFMLM